MYLSASPPIDQIVNAVEETDHAETIIALLALIAIMMLFNLMKD